MADIVLQHDVASLGEITRLSGEGTDTAGAAATTTGASIDRAGFGVGSLAGVVAVGIAFEATLASGKTLAFGYSWQDSADDTNFSDFQTASAAVVATGPSGGGAVSGTFQVEVPLNSARRYGRFNFLPAFSATGTDTAVARAVGFFAGFDRLPQ